MSAKPRLRTVVPKTLEPKGPVPKESEFTGSYTSRPLLPGPWHINALAFFVLTAATVGLYAGALQLGFFKLDDPEYVLENPWIQGVSVANLRHVLGAPYAANYSPLHLLSYRIAGVS